MFYYIAGELAQLDQSAAVVDAGGVGYLLSISGSTLGKLAGKVGQRVKLYTHMAVKEDAVELYGFFTTEELDAFRMLISVSGVGPKSAVSVLSLLTPERFALAVSSGDAKAISRASGIGPKSAARIVLELKDKVSAVLSASEDETGELTASVEAGSLSEAISALCVLGYTRSEAQSSLKGVDPTASLEDMIKYGLKRLMKQ